MLFQAGNSLTTGSFFNFFIYGFQPSALWLSLFMIIPETAQALGVFIHRQFSFSPRRKRTWLIALGISRTFAFLVPLALLFPAGAKGNFGALAYLTICVTGWYVAQGVAYVNYLSWLSDLAPRRDWGHLFSWRQIGGLLISVVVPLGTLQLRNRILSPLPDEAERWSYAVIFTLGGLLVLASVLPLMSLPERPAELPSKRHGICRAVDWDGIWQNRNFRWLLASRWTLAVFQGLTQAVLFKYAVGVLKVSLPTYLMLISLMLVLQLPLAWLAGKFSDREQDRGALFCGLLLVSLAMPCWLMATPEHWQWLIPAYAFWGFFALVNVCGTNSCLKLAPAQENRTCLALYEQGSGLLAGVAGLIGGLSLDQLLSASASPTAAALSTGMTPYHLLITLSWIGRVLAGVLALGVRIPAATEVGTTGNPSA